MEFTMIKSTIMALALMIATGAMASNANAAMISPFQFTPVVAEMAAPNANLHVVKFGDRFKKWGRVLARCAASLPVPLTNPPHRCL